MFEDPKSLQSFSSSRPFHDPDVASYEKEKRVHVIREENAPFLVSLTLAGLNDFEAARLGTARYYRVRRPYATRFPGHTLPAPGNGPARIFQGDMEIERFEELAVLGGLPIADLEAYPAPICERIPPLKMWPWKLPEPTLEVMKPLPLQTTPFAGANRWEALSDIARTLSRAREANKVHGVLHAVRRLWGDRIGSNTEASEWAEEVGSAFGQRLTVPEIAFEIEALASFRTHAKHLSIHGQGLYGGMWIEVGTLPLERIHATELIETARLLQELVNIRTKGFAPVVVNEYHCNTDGSHRHTAAWLWNLLQECLGTELSLANPKLQERVTAFAQKNRVAMGPIIIRESLRALAEILDNPELGDKLKNDVVPHLGRYRPVTHLPVTLLLEYSAGTVVKKSYDLGTAVERVDPETYRLLAANPGFTLPARGPYHKTDRALLPWFQILEPV